MSSRATGFIHYSECLWANRFLTQKHIKYKVLLVKHVVHRPRYVLCCLHWTRRSGQMYAHYLYTVDEVHCTGAITCTQQLRDVKCTGEWCYYLYAADVVVEVHRCGLPVRSRRGET